MNTNALIEEWFYLYSDDVYSFLIYYTGSKDVEDLLQDVFIKAMKSINLFEDRSSPKTWLISIARNLVIDRSRRTRLFKFFLLELFTLKIEKTPEGEFLANETLNEIYNEISLLKTSYKEVLLCRLVLNYSVDQTSTILDWSPSKVSITYHRAIKALRKRLENHSIKGGTTDENTTYN
ncbi:RNA polymerase sigma factor [Litchfieldia alkalitelluris]|uniref:RNA polymerase sigma factor n=1 Tax=Litchfieldia alkalitelluris TaxID=304268 RepID=UPI000996BDAF|nr:RNA polymerase sigma factor [Litchfieldia alkalitelluris]